MEAAIIILQQLGGNKFIAMTGAKSFLGSENSLSFTLPRGFANKGINKVRITLLPTDLYKVEFLKFNGRKLSIDTVSEHEGVYSDQLRSLFTKETGLDTRI